MSSDRGRLWSVTHCGRRGRRSGSPLIADGRESGSGWLTPIGVASRAGESVRVNVGRVRVKLISTTGCTDS